jgi:hypothetical protein
MAGRGRGRRKGSLSSGRGRARQSTRCWRSCFVSDGRNCSRGGAADAVPEGGLTDVHRYLVIILAGQEVTIDITFPGDQAWDGHRSMCLACGAGHDFPAGDDPDAEKAALEASYCDPQVREPFIASLALASSLAGSI